MVAGRQRSSRNRNRSLLQSLSIPVVEWWRPGKDDREQKRSDPLRVGLDHHAAGVQIGNYLRSRYRGKAGYVGVKVGEFTGGVDRLQGVEELLKGETS